MLLNYGRIYPKVFRKVLKNNLLYLQFEAGALLKSKTHMKADVRLLRKHFC